MYEKKHQSLLPKKHFYRRILKSILIANFFLAISLFIGISGYHWICGLTWINSLMNASMILAGMGPVDLLTTVGGKLFASFYAIFSGIAFLTTIGVIVAPIAHRFMHKFHMQDNNE
ncbi:MAG: hypothetical protein NT084_14790 [Bacteroidetes bacterium]|jgi:hypothetical protein|nr:hypothetical protein [Bacteroidota bacterium]